MRPRARREGDAFRGQMSRLDRSATRSVLSEAPPMPWEWCQSQLPRSVPESRSQSSTTGPDCWAMGTRGRGVVSAPDERAGRPARRDPGNAPRFAGIRGPGRAAERFASIGIIQRWGWLIAIGLAVVIAGIGIGIFVLSLLIAGFPTSGSTTSRSCSTRPAACSPGRTGTSIASSTVPTRRSSAT